jgi:hypothetical protein
MPGASVILATKRQKSGRLRFEASPGQIDPISKSTHHTHTHTKQADRVTQVVESLPNTA